MQDNDNKLFKCRKVFSFDLDTKKLEQYTKSKTKAYSDIKKFLVDELKFKHCKDSDYVTPIITNFEMDCFARKIINKIPYLLNVAKRITVSDLNLPHINYLDNINTLLYSKPKLKEKTNEFKNKKEKDHKEEFKL
ncbi:MAG: hypothetical protein LBH55_00690 [Mycoplasmataceae bacterium]|jgi:virulence-associated protein VapD|nr:hypothetical protein [Mycoplasmataceae bacterium]